MPLNQTLRKNSSVLWSISIIQDQNPEAQTKAEFAEMANDVINTSTIDQVTLCLADNLQRFRLMINDGLSEEEATLECQKMGVRWHEDNKDSLQKLIDNKKLSILTWQEFQDWPMYSSTMKNIENLYKENKEFRNDVDGRVRQAINTLKSDAKISNNGQQTALLRQYLFEECAFQKFATTYKFDYEIYKTQMCKAMRRIKNNSDFVSAGYMMEVYFTQFSLIQKKSKEPFYPSGSVFSITPKVESINKPQSQKALEFLEKAFQLIPPEKHERAIEALLKFTNQEIIPLCYSNNGANLKT